MTKQVQCRQIRVRVHIAEIELDQNRRLNVNITKLTFPRRLTISRKRELDYDSALAVDNRTRIAQVTKSRPACNIKNEISLD